MTNTQAFCQYLTEKGKKQAYIDSCKDLICNLYDRYNLLTSETIDAFVRSRWSGYVSRDRATYQILNDYADFCEKSTPSFTSAFREHIRKTFEGEARKAMKAYKSAIVPIPENTIINPSFLNGLSNEEFIEAYKSLQKFIYDVYDDIEYGSPFGWGWPDWKAITAEGINQNRVMIVLDALVGSGILDGNALVVDKKHFGRYGICKPIAKTKLMLEGFIKMGLHIEGLDDKKSTSFTVSYPDAPNLIAVLFAYFKKSGKEHVSIFSYRFAENPDTQIRETFFLAKTDGEPERLRKIYYWLYDEAVKHKFSPTGYEYMGCYLYKKGSKEWLLLGSGSSYHEDEFLHSPNYALAAKVRFFHVFQTHPDKMADLMKRFPDSFGRPWTQCYKCKAEADDCSKRITFEKNGHDYNHCGHHHYFYFHNPNFDDVKDILELYKLENKINLS